MTWVIIIFIVLLAIGIACLKFLDSFKKELEDMETNLDEPYESLSRINWDLYNENLENEKHGK